jgi:hypothetical protein
LRFIRRGIVHHGGTLYHWSDSRNGKMLDSAGHGGN